MTTQHTARTQATRIASALIVSLAWSIALLSSGLHPAASLAAAPGPDDKSKPFPDDWFFTNDAKQREPSLKDLEGKPAPTWTIDKWIGDEIKLKETRGKVVVVDFWATWCGPCRRAIPENIEMVKKYQGKLVFLGVHDSASGWDSAADVVKSTGINYPVGLDAKDGPSAKAYGLRFFPTYVAIDKRGIVRAAGLLPNRVEDVVKVLLAEADLSGSDLAEHEFPPEFYLGGFKAPRSLRSLEGKSLAQIEGLDSRLSGRATENDWIGAALSADDRRGRPVVLCFVSPTSLSMKEAAGLSKLSDELRGEGVVFMGVCDSRANWDSMRKQHEAKKLKFSIVRDLADDAASPANAKSRGAVAIALGVQFFPATVVIDGNGTIRCAGARTDKVRPALEKVLGRKLAAPLPDKEAPKPEQPQAEAPKPSDK